MELVPVLRQICSKIESVQRREVLTRSLSLKSQLSRTMKQPSWAFAHLVQAGQRFLDVELTGELLNRLCTANIPRDAFATLVAAFPRALLESTTIPDNIISDPERLGACSSAGMALPNHAIRTAIAHNQLRSLKMIHLITGRPHLKSVLHAVKHAATDCLSYLLDECKLDLSASAEDTAPFLPLHLVCSELSQAGQGRARGTIMALVGAGFDIEAARPDGDTPILAAARRKLLFVVSAFAEQHANSWARAKDGHTILSLLPAELITDRRVPGLTTTPAHSFYHECCPHNQYFLHYLIAQGHNKLLAYLLPRRNDWDLSFIDQETGLSVLEHSFQTLTQETAQALTTFVKEEAPHLLPQLLPCITKFPKFCQFDQIVNLVASMGRDSLNYRARPNFQTALHLLAFYGSEAEVESLLMAGGNPSVRNIHGDTPLHLSAQWAATTLPALFLQAGVNTSIANQEGETALIKFCQPSESNTAVGRSADFWRLLISSTPPTAINARDSRGNTALLYLIELGLAAPARLLLEFGADATSTSLSLACRREELLTMLLRALRQHAADGLISTERYKEVLNTPHPQWKAPLIAAVRANSIECVKLLLEDPATNLNITDVRHMSDSSAAIPCSRGRFRSSD